ncbi:MAG: hypothetical protein GEU82_06045 [Luteitalea sp.]|nr:hypothetical protein [Luteitalea sp.]
MTERSVLTRICAGVVLAGGVILSAQQLPSEPAKKFGSSITGAYEGWYDNPDGSHTFLVGYLNRNRAQAVDIPIGPNNRLEPGGPDLGQPTHFLPGRHVGMFIVTVPKEFTAQQRLTWTITMNGVTNAIPLRMHVDYNISPFEISHSTTLGNTPPLIRFDERGETVQGPIAMVTRPFIARTASVSAPLNLPIWTEDDAMYSSGTNAPMRKPPPPVAITWSKYRGPGTVTFDKAKPALETLAGGNVAEPYAGKGATTAKFSEAGEYLLHMQANDYSGEGGGGEVCCWTTTIVQVTVTP